MSNDDDPAGQAEAGLPTLALEATDGGLRKTTRPPPCVMVIFGAGGDLTRRQLIPSVYELAAKQLLPERFAVVGFSGGDRTDDEFRAIMRESAARECAFHAEMWDRVARHLHYVSGRFDDDRAYENLAARIDEIRGDGEIPDNLFFHLAAPPRFFGPIVERLGRSGLSRSEHGWRRLAVEKPFGEDRASSRTLDHQIRSVFHEEQVYRIDHFLGKETVQNMLVFRFANPSFEPIWNRDFIDNVQITVAEEIGIGTRGSFYESTGVVRDMIQNHLLQLLCMAAIEPPVSFDAQGLRDETVKVLRACQVTPFDPVEDVVLGQYGPGTVARQPVPGYREEDDVDPASTTATFAALRLTLDNWRWSGVPFYLRTGKRLARKVTEVAIHFRPTPHMMFADGHRDDLARNVLAFRLQPEEGIVQRFVAKQPGPEVALRPVTMHFGYADAFGVEEPPRAYAWLIRDVMQGDQRLFARADWIDEAWGIVDPLVSHCVDTDPGDFPNYEAGSWGPAAADALLEKEGRTWKVL